MTTACSSCFYNVSFRRGELYTHEGKGLEGAGNVNQGECGVRIRELKREHIGVWKCKVFRYRVDGLSGLEVVTDEIVVSDRLRTSRLNTDEVLQVNRNRIVSERK